MNRKEALLNILADLDVFYHDLNSLIIEYDTTNLNGNYETEWLLSKENHSGYRHIASDNQYLYVNCTWKQILNRYSFDGKFIEQLHFNARAMQIINNQKFYFIDDSKICLMDLQTLSIIASWNLPKESGRAVGGYHLIVDEKETIIYFTPELYAHYVYSFDQKKGEIIKKFGTQESSKKEGEFWHPAGITIDQQYLYVCDRSNQRVQMLNKDNGTYISLWKMGERLFSYPQSILLYENYLYIGDWYGIQVFTTEQNNRKCIQVIGISAFGSSKGMFRVVTSFCIVNDKLYIVDTDNKRVQVWN